MAAVSSSLNTVGSNYEHGIPERKENQQTILEDPVGTPTKIGSIFVWSIIGPE